MAVTFVVSLLGALYYVLPGEASSRSGPPQFAFASQVMRNTVSQVAPLLGDTPDVLLQRLRDNGFGAETAELTLTEIASRTGKSEAQLLQAVLSRR